jgi:hypothetical protein
MILALSVTSTLVWPAFWACIGGLFAFVGLSMEKLWDKRSYPSVHDLRRSKRISATGWWVLMLGIAIEVGTAGWLAYREESAMRQAVIQIANNAPLNQPVSDISARVVFKVKGREFKEAPLWGSPPVAYLMLCGSNQYYSAVGEFGFLPSSDLYRINYGPEDSHGYILHFRPEGLFTFTGGMAGMPPKKTSEVMAQVHLVRVDLKFVPHDSEVEGGTVDILINGGIRKVFTISPQTALATNLGGLGDVPGNSGFTILATNSTP